MAEVFMSKVHPQHPVPCQVLQFREKFKMRIEDSIVHRDAVAIRAFVAMTFPRHDGHKRKVH